MSARYPVFVKRDLDGFFGLAIDNLIQLLMIVMMCGALCGMGGDQSFYLYKHIFPGVAVSLLIGNVFYALQAHWVARREGRSDVTAQPYGINTPTVLIYILFVMKPAYERTVGHLGEAEAARFAWQLGLIACLGSGVIEFVGAFVAERLRRNTPRAALLGTLAGIAITFIALSFALEIWQKPLVTMVPLAIILLVFFSKARFPLGLPGGFVAVVVGTGLAWLFSALQVETGVTLEAGAVREACGQVGRYLPIWAGSEIWQTLRTHPGEAIAMLSVVIPMGLFNLVGSLQNIESAEAGGDVFATGPSLAVNGVGTIAAALFGSCFPTTIYIGHPGWKAMGARAGYSTLNGLVMTVICLTGTVAVISKVVPMEAGMGILLWIGVVITAQAFQTTPTRHAPAVALGLFVAIAAWGSVVVLGAFDQAKFHPISEPAAIVASAPATVSAPASTFATTSAVADDVVSVTIPCRPGACTCPTVRVPTVQDLLESDRLGPHGTRVNGFLIHGMNILERGYIFTCMILGAIGAFLVDRRFIAAGCWAMAAAVLTALGLMHAYQLDGNTIDYLLAFTSPKAEGAFVYRAVDVAIGYSLMAMVFFAIAYRQRGGSRSAATLEDARVVTADDLAPEVDTPAPTESSVDGLNEER